MAASVYKRRSAERDLIEHYVYLAERAGLQIAERFLSNADKSFDELSRHPGMGAAPRNPFRELYRPGGNPNRYTRE